jgi:hypothetical protein
MTSPPRLLGSRSPARRHRLLAARASFDRLDVVHPAPVPVGAKPRTARCAEVVARAARVFRIEDAAAPIPKVLALAGKRVVIGGEILQLGVPHVQALRPAPVLAARLVTTRNGQDEPRGPAAAPLAVRCTAAPDRLADGMI